VLRRAHHIDDGARLEPRAREIQSVFKRSVGNEWLRVEKRGDDWVRVGG
jgi:hypothetical protein